VLIVKNFTSIYLQLRVVQIEVNKPRDARANGCYVDDPTQAAMEWMDLYCAAHPRSPSAVRRPKLKIRGDLWIALLGPSVEEGIIGIGATVEAALRAFDAQYLAGLRPQTSAAKRRRGTANSRMAPT
jgi:hypothetical protein